MSNRNNNDRTYYENDPYFPNEASSRPQGSVVEIPVIHYPSANQNTQSASSENYSPTTQSNTFQYIPQTRTYTSFQQPQSLIDSFDSPFDHNKIRRPFQEPDLDDFFTPAFQPREFFSDRNSPSLFNRLGPDHIINRNNLSPSRASPTSSPKVSPRVIRKVNQDPVTIPVNYAKSPSKAAASTGREGSEHRDLPFGAYKATNQSPSKPNSYSDRNFIPSQVPQSKIIPDKTERSPSPIDTRKSPPNQQPMGNTATPKQQKSQDPYQQSSFVHLATEAAGFQTAPPRSTTPQARPRTSQEKIDEISSKLDRLEIDVENYMAPNEGKKDKQFLVLEEFLVQCLLQLDEIDRDDDKINQMRRKLISNTQKCIDKLESKLITDNSVHKVNNSNNESDKHSPENQQELTDLSKTSENV